MTTVNPREHHAQVKVRHPDGGEIEVDAELADLLSLAWEAEVETIWSCQDADGTGTAYIAFPTWADAERFLSIAAHQFS